MSPRGARRAGPEGVSKKSKKESKHKYREPGYEEVEQRQLRCRTNDGLTIYSANELGFGKADASGTRSVPSTATAASEL